MLALQSGLIIITVIFRLPSLKNWFFTLTAGKMWFTIVALTFAIVPGVSTVDMDAFSDDSYPITLYWQYVSIGFFAGILLGIINKLTHALCFGLLRHESYMNFYGSLVTVCLVPLFIMLQKTGS